MKIFIVGAGAVGSVLINALAKNKNIELITCLVNDKNKAMKTLPKDRKIKIISGDIKNTSFSKKITSGSDLIINAASPWLNVPIMKLALSTDAHYMDLSAYLGFDNGKSRQPYRIEHKKFDSEFKKKKLVALFDAGAAPGLTNLLVGQIYNKYRNIEHLKIMIIEDIQSKQIISTWSPMAMIDEIYSRPVICKNSKFKLIERYSDPISFKFPKPFGKKITYSIMNNEAFTIPQYLPIRNVEVRSAGSDDEVGRILSELNLLTNKKINFSGKRIKPVDLMMKIMPEPPSPSELNKLMDKKIFYDGNFAIGMEAIVRDQGKKRKIWRWVKFPSQRELFRRKIYSTFIAYPAGLCAAAFALEVPNIKKYGSFPPEALPLNNINNTINRIEKYGIKIGN